MRIRRKKWAREELDNSKFYIDKPEEFRGKWNTKFENNNEKLYLELGCGKGMFISKLASSNKNINYIAVDMIEAMLGLSKRNIESAYNFEFPENLLLIRANVELIEKVFSEEDKIDRIYINFCNPWPKEKHKKRRLTHTRQLEKYKTFLKGDSEIYFKTDDDELFADTLEYLKETNYEICKITYDLHSDDIFGNNIKTEHEEMFSNEGIKIKALIAKINLK